MLNGKDVWRLYDTFGFPVDLTRLMAEELKLGIDDKEFEKAQAWSKEASRASQKKESAVQIKLDVHDIAALEQNGNVPKTDDSAKFSKSQFLVQLSVMFIVSTALGTIDSRVVGIHHSSKQLLTSTSSIPHGEQIGILLDRTNFYAESCGQEYDTGSIVIDGSAEFEVNNVQVYNGYVLHTGTMKYGELEVGSKVIAQYDEVSTPQI